MNGRLAIPTSDTPQPANRGARGDRAPASSLRLTPMIDAAVASPAVRSVNLCKVIDDRPILRDLTFELPAACYVGLLGANGAGKTTLLRLLSTLTTPTRGDLEIFGRSVRGHGPAIRAGIGLIGHQPMLYRDLSALENLVFFGRLHEFVGLADRAHDAVKTFSRGMVQRVSIARSLLHEPRLLLADEPFAGLDAPSARTVERLLEELNGQGMAVILANHDVRQSLRLAQRVLVLRRGRLALDAPAASLSADEALEEIEKR